MHDEIIIKGAKNNNLKNITLNIPKNKLVVMTGVSGSGKSTLAFDTLYAEGQRRYVESLSSYARQFLGLMEKPDVDSIEGLSPAISIDQKTSSNNPRSTVGTVTEIYDYIRLLYGQVGDTHCPNCGNLVNAQTIQEIANNVLSTLSNKYESNKEKTLSDTEAKIRIQVLSPIVQDKKGEYIELFDRLLSKGFLRVRVDGEIYSLDDTDSINLNKNISHTIDLIIDRLISPTPNIYYRDDIPEYIEFYKRLIDAIELASTMAEGEIKILINNDEYFYSENNTCKECKISFPKIQPASFSFNSPIGACEVCSGLGTLKKIDLERIYNPNLSILEGGIFPWSNVTTKEGTWTGNVLKKVAEAHGFDLKAHIGEYSKDVFDLIFFGTGKKKFYRIQYRNKQGQYREYDAQYEGVIPHLERSYKETTSDYIRFELERYMIEQICPSCEGKRLKPYSLAVTINDKNIYEISKLQINESIEFFSKLRLGGNKKEIATPILKEIISRLNFLRNVGLDYLTLDRKANTLSGGESQRIRLASQIGTGLTGVLYVLDEPSIGLHPRDVSKLISTLNNLRDLGNSVIVVEHDEETISSADYIIDFGPEAGENGGEIVAKGVYNEFINQDSLTAKYLRNELKVGDSLESIQKTLIGLDINDSINEDKDQKKSNKKNGKNSPSKITKQQTQIQQNRKISLGGVTTHNLKNVDLQLPLGKFICITGVSGSGKSSLINDTLYPILMNEKMHGKRKVGEYKSVDGLDDVDKVIGISQSPIGRTPRSNPITYTGGFTKIRELFASTSEARARGYKPGRFSFNVKGGRCEKCKGDGQIKIDMQFLPDMYVTCEECGGKRYNQEALQIDYKGKNIADVLDMRVTEAIKFFNNISTIKNKLTLLEEVGLGYIKLGQYATTLSGGESQRIKLAKELSKSVAGHTVYILDEPTTGLHFHDIDKLLVVLKKLVEKNNTVIVIEHNLDIVRFADWIVDLGPEGGDKGGYIIAEGTVEDIISNPDSETGKYLKKHLEKINN